MDAKIVRICLWPAVHCQVFGGVLSAVLSCHPSTAGNREPGPGWLRDKPLPRTQPRPVNIPRTYRERTIFVALPTAKIAQSRLGPGAGVEAVTHTLDTNILDEVDTRKIQTVSEAAENMPI